MTEMTDAELVPSEGWSAFLKRQAELYRFHGNEDGAYIEALASRLESGVIVPREPTQEMIKAGIIAGEQEFRQQGFPPRFGFAVGACYRAMLQAQEEQS